jgi:hypothetical protein
VCVLCQSLLPQVAVLQAGRVGPEFFCELSRVRSIHEHCMHSLSSIASVCVLCQFMLPQVAVLQAGRVGPEFFCALSRVRSIHDHCQGLLRSHHQRAGLELMDQMAAHQEAAYEHLCR